jgi:hypothetical protein
VIHELIWSFFVSKTDFGVQLFNVFILQALHEECVPLITSVLLVICAKFGFPAREEK